jgi:hypothetical protein
VYSALFQAGGLVVVVVEIFRRNFLASMVPVIVNAILNEHQLVIDIVAFVIKGDFHRSRLGEKQRGKILAGWVTRKMRTIAQYSIRDVTDMDNQITEVAEPAGRHSTSTYRNSGGPGSVKGSMRASSTLGMTAAMNNLQLQTGAQELPGHPQPQPMGASFGPSFPVGVSEMPGERYPESIPELGSKSIGELGTGSIGVAHGGSDSTPTGLQTEFPTQSQAANGPVGYSPLDTVGVFDDDTPHAEYPPNHQQYGAEGLLTSPHTLPEVLRSGPEAPPQPHYSNKPYLNYQAQQDQQDAYAQQQAYSQFEYQPDVPPAEKDRWNLPSQSHQDPQSQPQTQQQYASNEYEYGGHGGGSGGGGGGGLRVANASSSRASSESEDSEWRQEALMTMNFAGSGPDSMKFGPGAPHAR